MSENQWALVGKYVSGQATEEEKEEVKSLMDSDPSIRQHVEESEWIWNSTGKVQDAEAVDTNAAWNKVASMTGLDHSTSRTAVPKGKTASMSSAWWPRVAAVLVAGALLAAIGYFAIGNMGPDYELATSENEVREISLPDGSVVTLNTGSTLSYSKDFDQEIREVHLQGQGFFDVAGNPQKPFVVITENAEVSVLGTSFDVNAYESADETSVVVATGKVRVQSGTENVELLPGDIGMVNNASRSLKKEKADIAARMSWRLKSFTFQGESLGSVVEKLSEAYHMDVRLSGESLKNCQLSATFSNKSLSDILQIISSTLTLKVENTKQGYLLSGEGC